MRGLVCAACALFELCMGETHPRRVVAPPKPKRRRRDVIETLTIADTEPATDRRRPRGTVAQAVEAATSVSEDVAAVVAAIPTAPPLDDPRFSPRHRDLIAVIFAHLDETDSVQIQEENNQVTIKIVIPDATIVALRDV